MTRAMALLGALALAGTASAEAPSEAAFKAIDDRIWDLERRQAAILEKRNEQQGQIEQLLRRSGLKLGGEVVFRSVNLLRMTPLQDAQRRWPSVGYFDLRLSADPHPLFSAEMVYRMETVWGGYNGALNVPGVRHLSLHANTPLALSLGDLSFKHSPLTVWAQEDPMPFEIEVLARKRREGMAELYLGDNRWPLQGGQADLTLLLAQAADLDLMAMGARLAVAGQPNTDLSFAVTYPYDQYLVGTTALLRPAGSHSLGLGGAYFEIMEAHDSAVVPIPLYREQRGNVTSLELSLGDPESRFHADLEGAAANYTPDYGGSLDWSSGRALEGRLRCGPWGGQWLEAHFLEVEESFINYAAQTRVQDSVHEPLGLTSNNLYNPTSGGYGGTFGTGTNAVSIDNGPLTRFNRVIFASNQGIYVGADHRMPGGNYLTHDPSSNQSLPMGLATPNRSGGGLRYRAQWWQGLLQPQAEGGAYCELKTAWSVPADTGARRFMRAGGGLASSLAAWGLPLTLSAGVMTEDTRADKYVALSSLRSDLELQWAFVPTAKLLLGYEHRDWNGYDFLEQGQMRYAWAYQDRLLESYAAALDWALHPAVALGLSYTYHDLIERQNGSANVVTQETEAHVAMHF